MIKIPFYYMLLALRLVFSTWVYDAERKKHSRQAAQTGKEQAVPTPTRCCWELPPAHPSLWVRKQACKVGQKPVVSMSLAK